MRGEGQKPKKTVVSLVQVAEGHMRHKSWIFSDKTMLNLIHRFLFSTLVLICVNPFAYGAGYTCPAYKKYTSCSSGYYLNGTGAGNSCDACPSGCTCAGGTAQPVCNCDPGYYKLNGECVECGAGGYYCPGDNNRYRCPANNQDLAILSGAEVLEQKQEWSSSSPRSTNAGQCMGDAYIKTESGTYLAECSWNGKNYYDACNGDFLWYAANTGYYLYGYKSTSWEAWYSGARACTNAPANSHYTGAGDPETNNCPWICDAGYYLSGGSCVQCESVYYCPGDNNRYSCPTPQSDKYYTYGWAYSINSPKGSTSITQCNLDRALGETWIYEFQYNGLYRWTGKCYYSPETEIYNNCENDRYFRECNAGYYASTIPLGPGFSNSCQPCDAGSYTKAAGHLGITGSNDDSYHYATSCTLCETGTYNDKSAGTSCTACTNGPDNSHYVGTGANSANCQWECDTGHNKTVKNTCAPVCDAGITTLRVGNISIPLYKSRNTAPALNIGFNGQVCYGDLADGDAAGELNINYGGKTYHTAK